jgi:hypothetical protein
MVLGRCTALRAGCACWRVADLYPGSVTLSSSLERRDSPLGGGGGAPQIDSALDRVAVDICELIGGEIELVERCDVLLELRDAARTDQQ